MPGKRRRSRWRANVRGEPAGGGIVRARHWFVPRSIDVCSDVVCGHLHSVFVCCSSGTAQSVRCRVFEPLTQRIGIVAAVGYDALRLLPRAAARTGYADFCDRGLRKVNFTGGGTFQPNSHRKTLTVDQYHPLRALAALGFSDCGAPFFAGAKLPSRKVSSHLSNPRSSSAPSRVRQVSSQTPFSCQRCNRPQHVEGDGNSSGRNRHAAPVCRTQSVPSKHARFGAGGRPRLSRRLLGLGSKGSISFHCSSVNSFCRFFMTEAQQPTHLTRKYLI